MRESESGVMSFIAYYCESEASPTLGCSIEISRDICNSYTIVVRDYRC